MKRVPFSITMREDLLEKVDSLVDGAKIRNRSHAFEYIASSYFKTSIKKGLILAGGKGVKMRPFTYELPKAMLPIKDKPILEHIIELLRHHDIREVYIVVGYLGDKIKKYFGDGSKLGVDIIYIEEKDDLGTGGALKKALPKMGDEPFIMTWGDVLIDIDISDMIDFHLDNKPVMTIALTSVSDPTEYGAVKLSRDTMVDFKEKPKKSATVSHLVSSGVFVVDPAINKYLPSKKNFNLEREVISDLTEKKKVKGYVFDGLWFDVGTPDVYELAVKKWTSSIEK